MWSSINKCWVINAESLNLKGRPMIKGLHVIFLLLLDSGALNLKCPFLGQARLRLQRWHLNSCEKTRKYLKLLICTQRMAGVKSACCEVSIWLNSVTLAPKIRINLPTYHYLCIVNMASFVPTKKSRNVVHADVFKCLQKTYTLSLKWIEWR